MQYQQQGELSFSGDGGVSNSTWYPNNLPKSLIPLIKSISFLRLCSGMLVRFFNGIQRFAAKKRGAFCLNYFQSLIFSNQVKFECRAYPRCKHKGNVFMRISSIFSKIIFYLYLFYLHLYFLKQLQKA
jgi:hypothetical protein